MTEDAYWKTDPYGREHFAGFERGEVSSTYVQPGERFVVSLVVGYGDGDGGVATPQEACYRALELTRDEGSSGTHWYVYDRKTGKTLCLEQQQFDVEGWDNLDEEEQA